MSLVSKLILGTVQFGLDYGISNTGGKTQPDEAMKILALALASGITTLDTAHAYGDALSVIGKFHEVSEHKFKVNSKFKNDEGLSIRDQLNFAIDKLLVPGLNTFFYHRADEAGEPSTMTELKKLKDEKLIGTVGVSVYDNDQFRRAIRNESIDVIQIPYNVLDNTSKRGRLVNAARAKGKEVQCRSVFLQGLLFMESRLPEKLSALAPYLRELGQLSHEHGIPIGELALRYALSNDGIEHVLIGVESSKHLESNLAYANDRLPATLIEKIDRINVREIHLLNPQNWN